MKLELLSSFVTLVTFALAGGAAVRDDSSAKASLPAFPRTAFGTRRRNLRFA